MVTSLVFDAFDFFVFFETIFRGCFVVVVLSCEGLGREGAGREGVGGEGAGREGVI